MGQLKGAEHDGPRAGIPLVGLYFVEVLETPGGGRRLLRMGQIAGNPEPGWYLLDSHEWLTGAYSHTELCPVEQIRTFRLHKTWSNLLGDAQYKRGVR